MAHRRQVEDTINIVTEVHVSRSINPVRLEM